MNHRTVHFYMQAGSNRHLCGHREGADTIEPANVTCRKCSTVLAKRVAWLLEGKTPCEHCGGAGKRTRNHRGPRIQCINCNGTGLTAIRTLRSLFAT